MQSVKDANNPWVFLAFQGYTHGALWKAVSGAPAPERPLENSCKEERISTRFPDFYLLEILPKLLKKAYNPIPSFNRIILIHYLYVKITRRGFILLYV